MKQRSLSIGMKPVMVGLFFVGSCLPFFGFAEESLADQQDGKGLARLDEIVVTATKIEEPKRDIPASIQVISREDIKNSTARNAGDLIAEASLGHITKYGNGLTSEIQLRGLSSDLLNPLRNRVLLLINGSQVGTVNLAKIPVDDMERIEIVKGPASVLYGSSAMGGVINIITREGKEGFQGSVSGEMGSWGYWKTGAELSGKRERFAYYLTASRQAQGDYETASQGKIQNSGTNAQTLSTRLGYRLFDDHHISIGYQHWKGWGLGSPGPRYSPDPDNYSDKQRDQLDIHYKTESFSAKFYRVKDWDESHGGMTSGIGNSNIYITDTDSQGLNLQKLFAVGDHRIIVGGQWDRIAIGSSSNTGAPYNPDSRYDSYGAFSEGRLSLLDKRLLVNVGLRYDFFQNEILQTPGIKHLVPKTEHLDHGTARGGMVYKLFGDFNVKGNIGTAFRAPAPLELAADYVSWGRHYVGNPNLKPERSLTWDGGIDYAKGLFRGEFIFFHTDFRDKIVSAYDPSRKVSTYRNTDGAILQGLELNASYDLGPALGINLFVYPFTNITYMTRRLDGGGGVSITLLNTPEWTGALGIKAGQENWEARLMANYTGSEKVQDWNTASSTYGQAVDKGDFIVLSLSGSFRPLKNLELSASIENLLDRSYEYRLGYPMPGRKFIGGIRWLY